MSMKEEQVLYGRNVSNALADEVPEKTDEVLDLESQIELQTVPMKLAESLLGILYESSVPSAAGVEIDDIRDEGCGWLLLAVYVVSFTILFSYFLWTGTWESYKSLFLSIKNDTENHFLCDFVALSLKASYSGDIDGYWESDSKFNYNRSVFVIDFHGTQVTNDRYSTAMEVFQSKLKALGSKSLTRNVAWSLLAWTSLSITSDGIKFSSDVQLPYYIDKNRVSGSWSTRNNFSTDSITGEFDQVSNNFVLNIPFSLPVSLQSDPITKILTSFAQSSPLNSADFFKYEVDARSIQVAIALNFGLLSTSQLSVVSPEFKSVFKKFLANGTFYVDRRFISMQPIFCLDSAKNSQFPICYVAFGNNGAIYMKLGYPMVDQFKYDHGSLFDPVLSSGHVTSCGCPADKENDLCVPDGITYTIIYSIIETTIYDLGKTMHAFLVRNSSHGDKDMMAYIAPITTYSIMIRDNWMPSNVSLSNSTASSYLNESMSKYHTKYNFDWAQGKSLHTLLEESWDTVCPSKSCGAVIFHIGDKELGSHLFNPINNHGTSLGDLTSESFIGSAQLSVPTIMCTDTFTQATAFTSFIKTPPVPLVQPYFECHLSLGKAFRTAVGNAYSTASMFCNIGITILGFLVVYYINRNRSIKMNGRTLKKLKKKKLKDYVQTKVNEKTLQTMNETLEAMAADMLLMKEKLEKDGNENVPEKPRKRNRIKKMKNDLVDDPAALKTEDTPTSGCMSS